MYARDHALIATPIGMIRIWGNADHIVGITIEPDRVSETPGITAPVIAAEQQLRAWFAGERRSFSLPLAPANTSRGGVLRNAMRAIPYGAIATYGTVAASVGSSARAMGGACRSNPFPIVVPCHRVISAGGAVHYSAGDGPATKQWLLAHEQHYRRA